MPAVSKAGKRMGLAKSRSREDQCSRLTYGRSEHVDIGRPGQSFVPDGLDVVAGIAELVGPPVAEVLVELEPHATST